MGMNDRQELITKLAKIGYEAAEPDKQSIFYAIAAVYGSDEFAQLVSKHVDDVISLKCSWDKSIIKNIPNV